MKAGNITNQQNVGEGLHFSLNVLDADIPIDMQNMENVNELSIVSH